MSTTDDLSKDYSGLLGSQMVVKRGRRGKNVISLAKLRTKRVLTEKQLNQAERLSMAAEYARIALQDPSLKEIYNEKAKKGFSATGSPIFVNP